MKKISWLLIIGFILVNVACAEEAISVGVTDMSRRGPPYETKKVPVATECISIVLSGNGSGCSRPMVVIKPEVRESEIYLTLYIKEKGNCEAEWSFSETAKVCSLKSGEYTFYYPQGTSINVIPENKESGESESKDGP